MPALDKYFKLLAETGASDLHVSSGEAPMMRLHGSLKPCFENEPPLTSEGLLQMFEEITPKRNLIQLEEENDTDFAYEISGLARYRANLFRDRKGVGGVFRIIPSKIMTAEDLGLSPAILDLCYLNKGMVLVTGPTGSGKSTTLCAMVDFINRNRTDHIITIEDPIEFVHDNKRCLINQREVGVHTTSFKRALRASLREDPDIILVGEMRDLETIAIAIEMAETGHLVFGTLHTTTAASTIDRVIDQFPAGQQNQIRAMLSESLKGVIAQTLCKTADGKGRRAALEILLVTPAVAANIREGKTHQIPLAMQTGRSLGMQSLTNALLDLVKAGTVTSAEAYAKAVDKTTIEKEFERAQIPFSRPTSKGAAKPARPSRPPQGRPQGRPAQGRPPSRPPQGRPVGRPPQGQRPQEPPKKKGWFG